MHRTYLLFPLVLLLCSSCQSIQKLYDAGEYDKAYKASLRQLQTEPNDEEARFVLEQSFEQLWSRDQASIMTMRQQQSPEAWEKALRLIDKSEERLLEVRPHLNEQDEELQQGLAVEHAEIRSTLYHHYLAEGEATLENARPQDDAMQAQKAYGYFQRAEDYAQSDYQDYDRLPALMNAAEELGVVYYEVEVNEGFNQSLGLDIEGYFSSLEEQSSRFHDIKMVFIANGGDCAIDIDFDRFTSTIVEDLEIDSYETEVVISYEQEVDTLGVITQIPVYQTVQAQVHTTTSRKTGTWTVSVDVDKRTNNCHHFGSRYREEVVSERQYYMTFGDVRALPQEYQNTDAMEAHTEDGEMAEELLERFYLQICADYFSD